MSDTNLNTSGNVSAGKPKTTGAIYRAPLNTTLPTTADAALDSAFGCVGYISDAGVTNSNTRTNTEVKAWGGAVVLNTQTEKKDTFKYKMIEVLNDLVLKTVHGDTNVTGTLSTGIAVSVNAKELESHSWVIDQIMTNGVLFRTVIPSAKVTEIADVVYNDTEPVGYEITLATEEDSSGNTHYEYYKAAASATSGTSGASGTS